MIAHPGRYDLGFVNMHLLMHEFRGHGGEAIEVVTGSHTPPQYDQFAKIAHRFSLKASQGSDYHGPGLSYMEMGYLPELPKGCVPVGAGLGRGTATEQLSSQSWLLCVMRIS